MPSTYLYLNTLQRNGSKWNNLPTLSASTRECYLTITYARIIFTGAGSSTLQGIVLKINTPTLNYTSSNNDNPVIAILNRNSNTIFITPDAPPMISLFTNDNLKNIEFTITDQLGADITLVTGDAFEVLFQIDYVDQQEVVEKYKSEMPMRL
jgi:hypothetical protein